MVFVCLAGQEFCFPYLVTGLESFDLGKTEPVAIEPSPVLLGLTFCNRTTGLVGKEWREVESWIAPSGLLIKVTEGSNFIISSGGQDIIRVNGDRLPIQLDSGVISDPDSEILLGPVLVLGLALRGVWCLHASAAMFTETTIAFLGESGEGKSTLAAYLSQNTGWRLVADDILPVTGDPSGVWAWPRFPQLKLPPESQPGPLLPEQLPLGKIVLLIPAGRDDSPEIQLLPAREAVKVLLAHTAGTRLFSPDRLAKHLEFCARSAEQVPVYRLNYPHRREALPEIREMLENLC